MTKSVLVCAMIVLLSAGVAHATISLTFSSWGITTSTASLQVSNCPAGDFETIMAGGSGTGSIWVIILDTSSIPVSGIPRTDIYWQPCPGSPGTLCWCSPRNQMDAPTNAAGWAQATGTLCVGGCALNGIECRVFDSTIPAWVVLANPPCVPNVQFKSPDLNADCMVNLSDLVPFGNSYNKNLGQPGYNACCDYNDDNRVNLSDFAFFSAHYQHRC